MGYKPAMKKKYTLSDIAASEVVKDTRGREWGVRVYTLRELTRFQKLLVGLLAAPGAREWTRFLQAGLKAPEPGLLVRLRRAAGLPDFSVRRIARDINMKDAALLRDAIVRSNLDVEYGEFASRCGEAVKKKIAERQNEKGKATAKTGEQ
jgi:hypothetical protein